MKKLLLGFIIGATVTGFSILFSGCNHHDKDKAEIYFVTTDDEAEVHHEHTHGHGHENHEEDNDTD